jgi:hypothetical protein
MSASCHRALSQTDSRPLQAFWEICISLITSAEPRTPPYMCYFIATMLRRNVKMQWPSLANAKALRSQLSEATWSALGAHTQAAAPADPALTQVRGGGARAEALRARVC